jgi:hypothetical protein
MTALCKTSEPVAGGGWWRYHRQRQRARQCLVGNWQDNWLNGYEGSDTLTGGEGHDELDGGVGADSMEGGIGDDIYYVDDLPPDGQAAGAGISLSQELGGSLAQRSRTRS